MGRELTYSLDPMGRELNYSPDPMGRELQPLISLSTTTGRKI